MRGKKVVGRKRFVAVDTLGLLWALMVVPASVQRLQRRDVAHVRIDAEAFVSPVIASYRKDDASPFLAQALALAAQLAKG